MKKFQVITKQTHYFQNIVEAINPDDAVRRLREEDLKSEAVNVDEYFGDWQQLNEGEVVSVLDLAEDTL